MPITRHIICPHCGKVARESEVILKSDKAAQALGFRNIEELVRHYRSEGLAYYQIAEKTGIPKSTIEHHIPEDVKGYRAKTEKHKLACRNNGKRLVAMRMKKFFDHPKAGNGKSNKQLSLEAMEATKQKLFRGAK
jgi:DNA-binding transcriptional ArsR family regulator